MTKTEVRKQFLGLPEQERLDLLEDLWRDQVKAPLPDWQKELLQERLATHEKNPEGGESWEEVKRELWPELCG